DPAASRHQDRDPRTPQPAAAPSQSRVTGRPTGQPRRRGLPRPQRHRTRLQRRETVAWPGHPLRQTRPDLPRRSRPPRHRPVAQPPALETCPRLLPMTGQRDLAHRLLRAHGRTFAADAAITLRDKPAPLWQLLVLSLLLSTRISSDIAVATARELFSAGWRTPEHLRESTWQERVDALGRGGYRRYDESTATRLDDAAALLLDRWKGDLRRLRDEAEGYSRRIADLLQAFDGIGPTGASIFLREVQQVWPAVRPFADDLVLKGARAAGLPQDAESLAGLVDEDDFAGLASALVRIARDPDLLHGDGDEPSA